MDSSNYEYDPEWKKKLPIGFHFIPTDEELNTYLKLKSCGGKIPHGIFTDLDIYKHEPHELRGLAEKHWDDRMYFFTLSRRKNDTGTRLERKTPKGVWKASQARKNLSNNEKFGNIRNKDVTGDDVQIGTKTSLVYWESKTTKTSWLMSEYRFPDELHHQPVSNEIKDKSFELTLNVIYYNGTKKNNDDDHDKGKKIVEYCNDLIPQPNPINFDHDIATTSTMQPSFHQTPTQSYTEAAATTSTRQQSFPQPLCGVMENVDNDFLQFDDDISCPIPNIDFLEFDPFDQSISQYFDFDNFPCIKDEDIISHIPISQDDQTPSSDIKDPQLQMKKIKI
ncbi:NAC domain-containing protein 2-like [Capsicum galapagoense]